MLARNPLAELRLDAHFIMAHLLERRPHPFVVQVGAYDGLQNDFINPYLCGRRLPGLLIEPQATAFERLQSTYADQPQISLVRCAVSDCDGRRSLYRLDGSTEGLPGWAEQTATFNKDVLLSHRHVIPDIDSRIIEESVDCRTFESLFAEHKIESVDLLQIDAEGFDFELLKLFPFRRMQPLLIRYEHAHLTAADQEACLTFLADHGYLLFVPRKDVADYMDTIAYRLQ